MQITLDIIDKATEGADIVGANTIGARDFRVAFDNGVILDINLVYGIVYDSVVVRRVHLSKADFTPADGLSRDADVSIPMLSLLYHRLRAAFLRARVDDIRTGMEAHRKMCSCYEEMSKNQRLLDQRPRLKEMFGIE